MSVFAALCDRAARESSISLERKEAAKSYALEAHSGTVGSKCDRAPKPLRKPIARVSAR